MPGNKGGRKRKAVFDVACDDVDGFGLGDIVFHRIDDHWWKCKIVNWVVKNDVRVEGECFVCYATTGGHFQALRKQAKVLVVDLSTVEVTDGDAEETVTIREENRFFYLAEQHESPEESNLVSKLRSGFAQLDNEVNESGEDGVGLDCAPYLLGQVSESGRRQRLGYVRKGHDRKERNRKVKTNDVVYKCHVVGCPKKFSWYLSKIKIFDYLRLKLNESIFNVRWVMSNCDIPEDLVLYYKKRHPFSVMMTSVKRHVDRAYEDFKKDKISLEMLNGHNVSSKVCKFVCIMTQDEHKIFKTL